MCERFHAQDVVEIDWQRVVPVGDDDPAGKPALAALSPPGQRREKQAPVPLAGIMARRGPVNGLRSDSLEALENAGDGRGRLDWRRRDRVGAITGRRPTAAARLEPGETIG